MNTPNSTPAVSVIVPVYNLEHYVAATIESLRNQTFTDFEAVIVDDGSTDSSAEAVRAAIAGDGRFRLISKPNEGVSLTRKFAIAQAAGSYICFLDGDDTLAPDFIERLVTAAEDGTCDIVCCAGYLRTGGSYSAEIRRNTFAAEIDGWEYIRLMLGGRATASLWDKMYRRSLFDDSLRHYPVRVGEDLLLNLQIMCKRPSVRRVDYSGYRYLQRRGSATHAGGEGIDNMKEYYAAMSDSFSRHAEAAEAVDAPLLQLLDRMNGYCRYIERSHNRWIGDDPFVRELRRDAGEHRKMVRANVGWADRAMFALDRRRILRPAVVTISTVRRWLTSLKRRLCRQSRH